MTKTIKMSLVAALAVAGISTTASAGLKDASVSGKFEVEYDYVSSDDGTTESNKNIWDLDFDATIKVPVADNLTAIMTVQADNADDTENHSAVSYEPVDVAKHYFSGKLGGVTLNVGKQGMGTPFFADDIGSGVVAVAPLGGVTVAAGNFSNPQGAKDGRNANNISIPAFNDQHVTVAGVMGGSKAVKYSLWYAAVSEVADGFSLHVKTKVAGVGLDVRHSDLDYSDLATGAEASLTKLMATMPVGGAKLTAGYVMTNDALNRGQGVDLTGDDDAKSNLEVVSGQSVDDWSDVAMVYLKAATKMAGLGVKADILTGTFALSGIERDYTAYRVMAKKTLNKSTNLTAKYAMSNMETGATTEKDTTNLFLAVNYKF